MPTIRTKWCRLGKTDKAPEFENVFIAFEQTDGNISEVRIMSDGIECVRIREGRYGGLEVAVPEPPKEVEYYRLTCKPEDLPEQVLNYGKRSDAEKQLELFETSYNCPVQCTITSHKCYEHDLEEVLNNDKQ